MERKNKEGSVAQSSELRKMVFASLFAAMTAAGAYIRIPLFISPVPVTLQTLFVFLAGSMLKSKWGTLCMLVYALLGIAGMPVFTGGASGPGVILGPTGGYIIGFILAAFVIGYLSEKSGKTDYLSNALYIGIGLVIVYAMGVAQLALVGKLDLLQAITLGVLPFIPGDLLKLAVAAHIASRHSI
ncbi:Substrate-specific component BioY of biotin ECF transporter [Methanosarcina sp. MTP4]|uniref:biotin transporter BioY n=1 Tax=Methanosarcina sp. MTP4 TaxID=1434100 RepID=UPI0006161B37|nr:biotin transporter BioY [Methanosarcina sp. MTP4]AKB23766.1 Substrate-specific component BioY of biotin ECF transporter [Methanosarcina sp. MTP4]